MCEALKESVNLPAPEIIFASSSKTTSGFHFHRQITGKCPAQRPGFDAGICLPQFSTGPRVRYPSFFADLRTA
jgi:hypothetical protein